MTWRALVIFAAASAAFAQDSFPLAPMPRIDVRPGVTSGEISGSRLRIRFPLGPDNQYLTVRFSW
jgi:hypothetical protein